MNDKVTKEIIKDWLDVINIINPDILKNSDYVKGFVFEEIVKEVVEESF